METWKLLAATHLAAGVTGFVLAPRDIAAGLTYDLGEKWTFAPKHEKHSVGR